MVEMAAVLEGQVWWLQPMLLDWKKAAESFLPSAKCWKSGHKTFLNSWLSVTGKRDYWLFIFHSTIDGHSSHGGGKGEGKLAIIL